MATREEWTVQVFSHPDQIKDAEYRYWQGRTPHERMAAIFDFMVTGYDYGKPPENTSRFGGIVEVIQRPWR